MQAQYKIPRLIDVLNSIKADKTNRYGRKKYQEVEEYISVSQIEKLIASIIGGLSFLAIMILWILYHLISSYDITYSAPIKVKSEMTREEIKALNIMPVVSEKHRRK